MLPTDQTKRQYWLYLEALRRSGATNMFGAAPYIASEFDVTVDQARTILCEWMDEYDPDDYDDTELPEVELCEY